jgi:DNA-binding XRE family transcriptional regulator
MWRDESMAFINIFFHNKIRDKINEHKSKTGASRTFVAEKMGISRQSLNALEDSNNPTVQMLIKLAVVLGCKVDDLYSYDVFIVDEKNNEN